MNADESDVCHLQWAFNLLRVFGDNKSAGKGVLKRGMKMVLLQLRDRWASRQPSAQFICYSIGHHPVKDKP